MKKIILTLAVVCSLAAVSYACGEGKAKGKSCCKKGASATKACAGSASATADGATAEAPKSCSKAKSCCKKKSMAAHTEPATAPAVQEAPKN